MNAPLMTPAGALTHTCGGVASRSTVKPRTLAFVAQSVAVTGTVPLKPDAAVKVYAWLRAVAVTPSSPYAAPGPVVAGKITSPSPAVPSARVRVYDQWQYEPSAS